MIRDLFEYAYDVKYVQFDIVYGNRFTVSMTLILTPDLLRAARALTGLSQREVADRAGVAQKSVSQLELGNSNGIRYLNERLRTVYEEAGVEFIASSTAGGKLDGAGVRWKAKESSGETRII